MNKRKRMAVRKHRATARNWKLRSMTTTTAVPFPRRAPEVVASPVPAPTLSAPKPAPRRAPRKTRPAATPATAQAPREPEMLAES